MKIEGVKFLGLESDPYLRPDGSSHERPVRPCELRFPPNSLYPVTGFSAVNINVLAEIGLPSKDIWPALSGEIEAILTNHHGFANRGNFSQDLIYKEMVRLLKNYAVALKHAGSSQNSAGYSRNSGIVTRHYPEIQSPNAYELHMVGISDRDLESERTPVSLEEALDRVVSGDAARSGFLRESWDRLAYRNAMLKVLGLDIHKMTSGEDYTEQSADTSGGMSIRIPSTQYPQTMLQFARFHLPANRGTEYPVDSISMSVVIDRRIINNISPN